jgi:hypothetical protein
VDIERYRKVIERHLLSSLSDFLSRKGVDTRELEQRIQVIVNEGIWVVPFGRAAGDFAAWPGPQNGNSGNAGGKLPSLR